MLTSYTSLMYYRFTATLFFFFFISHSHSQTVFGETMRPLFRITYEVILFPIYVYFRCRHTRNYVVFCTSIYVRAKTAGPSMLFPLTVILCSIAYVRYVRRIAFHRRLEFHAPTSTIMTTHLPTCGRNSSPVDKLCLISKARVTASNTPPRYR